MYFKLYFREVAKEMLYTYITLDKYGKNRGELACSKNCEIVCRIEKVISWCVEQRAGNKTAHIITK